MTEPTIEKIIDNANTVLAGGDTVYLSEAEWGVIEALLERVAKMDADDLSDEGVEDALASITHSALPHQEAAIETIRAALDRRWEQVKKSEELWRRFDAIENLTPEEVKPNE